MTPVVAALIACVKSRSALLPFHRPSASRPPSLLDSLAELFASLKQAASRLREALAAAEAQQRSSSGQQQSGAWAQHAAAVDGVAQGVQALLERVGLVCPDVASLEDEW